MKLSSPGLHEVNSDSNYILSKPILQQENPVFIGNNDVWLAIFIHVPDGNVKSGT